MAKVLPARSAFPDRDPYVTADPGTEHLDVHAKDVVEEQHYLTAYYGRGHASQAWRAGATAGSCRVTAAAFTRVLVYDIVPRLHMTGLRWRFWVNSDAGGDVRVRVVEIPVNIDTNIAGAGATYGTNAVAGINRADLLTTVEVYMQRAGGGTYIDLLSFALWDDDLAVAGLP